jgi:hypothetical protein
MPKNELMIFTRKTPFMQACVDAARHHARYITGLIEVEKVATLHAKMARKYDLDLPKQNAYRLRKEGRATCRMLIYKLPIDYSMATDELGLPAPNTLCQWVVFSTDGEHPIGDDGDRWRDFRTDRLSLVGGVEMFMHTRPRQTDAKKATGGPSWSWRFTASHYSNLRNETIASIKRHEDWRLQVIIQEATKTPGFAGVRDQLKKLMVLISTTWGSTRKDVERPALPSRFGYVRRITAKQVSLAWCIKQTRVEVDAHAKRLAAIKAESSL